MTPWADVLYACDQPWWKQCSADVQQSFHGERWTQCPNAAMQFGLMRIHSEDRPGLSTRPGIIAQGGNSGYQAIGLAQQFGARRILLLGYDFQKTGGRSHWHGDHPRPLGNLGKLPKWAAAMNKLAADARQAGLDIINCSLESALTCFPRQALQECLGE